MEPKAMNQVRFSPGSVEGLQQAMVKAVIPVDHYDGVEGQTVEDLFAEVQDGECALAIDEDGKLTRLVLAVRIHVYCDGWVIYKAGSYYKVGRPIREEALGASFAKKVNVGQSPGRTLLVLIAENPGFLSNEAEILVAYNPKETREEKVSEYFPALPTKFVFLDYECHLIGVNVFREIRVEWPDRTVVYRWKPVPT